MLKFIGAILVIVGCGGFGFRIALNYKKEEKSLRQLMAILDYMECELQYRLTPLPDLCRQISKVFQGMPAKVFSELALEMEAQISPNLFHCMTVTLGKNKYIPLITREELLLLGKSMGRFDLDGQIKGLEAVRQDCMRNLEILSNNRECKLRSYQTLGLCAGAALAILLI